MLYILKKWFIPTFLVLVFLLILYKTYQQDIENPTDFKVQQYFFAHGENFVHTRLNVISCVQDYDSEKMMYRIKKYYDAIYGEADRLEIILFNSEEDFKNYDVYSEKTFYKYSWTNLLGSG